MGMIRSLPKMDIGTAMRCCAGGAAPVVEKIAAGSSGLKERGKQGKKTPIFSVYIKKTPRQFITNADI